MSFSLVSLSRECVVHGAVLQLAVFDRIAAIAGCLFHDSISTSGILFVNLKVSQHYL